MAPTNDVPEQGTTPGQASNPSPSVTSEDATPQDILRNAQNLIGQGNLTGARDQIDAAIAQLAAPKAARKGGKKSGARKGAAKKGARKGGAKRR